MAQRSTSRKPRSRGASRRSGSRKKSGMPGWAWLLTGVLAGLFAAFLIFLARADFSSRSPSAGKSKTSRVNAAQKDQDKTPASRESRNTGSGSGKTTSAEAKTHSPSTKEKVTETTASPAKRPEEQKDKPGIDYTFYKILPQYEVVVPENDPHQPATAASNSPGIYYLQVGAFRQMQEADSRKAELAMLGIVSSIQTVTIDPGNTWHRVRIGPVRDMRQLDRTKRQLQENNIAFVTLKEKS